MAAHRRSPRPLSAALGSLEHTLVPDTPLGEIQRRWPAAVGPAIAAQATPTTVRGGVLTVVCAASVWAQELDLMSGVVLAALNDNRPADRVTRLRCVVGEREVWKRPRFTGIL